MLTPMLMAILPHPTQPPARSAHRASLHLSSSRQMILLPKPIKLMNNATLMFSPRAQVDNHQALDPKLSKKLKISRKTPRLSLKEEVLMSLLILKRNTSAPVSAKPHFSMLLYQSPRDQPKNASNQSLMALEAWPLLSVSLPSLVSLSTFAVSAVHSLSADRKSVV